MIGWLMPSVMISTAVGMFFTALIALSIILTCIGGLIPSKNAAKKDPVTALRSE